MSTPKARALLFGLNYAHAPSATLNGCINDVTNMASYLQQAIPGLACETVTDNVNLKDTSAQGITRKLYELALKSYSENLEMVWIHYSGHGSYVRDRSGDEADGRDECLVPSDFQTAGLIPDDAIQSLLRNFNPNTRVVCIFDCCHSATIGDIRFCWESSTKTSTENARCSVKAKVITISGCRDDQTSADAFNVLSDSKFSGALTSCLLMALKADPELRKDVFKLVNAVRAQLIQRQFDQYPKLCSSYDLAAAPQMF